MITLTSIRTAMLIMTTAFIATGCSKPDAGPPPDPTKPSIDSVNFDTSAWSEKDKSRDAIEWDNSKADVLSLNFFNEKPSIPVKPKELKKLRDYYRTMISKAGGGLVSVDVMSVQNLPCIKTIFKVPQQPDGMTYVGSFTIPLADFSYVVKAKCTETGTTGIRDTMVMQDMMSSGKMKMGSFDGWAQDPYQPSFKGPALRNKSEDEKYDEKFPDHPLSRCRKILANVIATLKINDVVAKSAPFKGSR